MDTNGHEWEKKDLTTKNTKHTKKIAGGRVRTTNEHEKYLDSVFFGSRMHTNGHEKM